MNCILKKFIVKQTNKVLDTYKDDVQKARQNVDVWLSRAKCVVTCLESLSAKLADSKLDDTEIEEAVAEIQKLIESWKS